MISTKEVFEMRKAGMTYKAIADRYGVSRQYIQQVAPASVARKSHAEIETIPYKGIYQFLKENPRLSLVGFYRAITGGAYRNSTERVRNVIHGREDCRLSITEIRRLLEITGMTFDELFEKRAD